MLLSKLCALADSWEKEGREYQERAQVTGQQAFAHCILSCASELRRVISEAEKEVRDTMGDGIKAMYEDYDRYERLCSRYGQLPVSNMNGNYYLHQKWIREFFENKSTSLSWEEYLRNEQKRLTEVKIAKLKRELKGLHDDLED